MIYLKYVCMFSTVFYGFGNFGKLIRGHAIGDLQIALMSLGACGYLLLKQLGC